MQNLFWFFKIAFPLFWKYYFNFFLNMTSKKLVQQSKSVHLSAVYVNDGNICLSYASPGAAYIEVALLLKGGDPELAKVNMVLEVLPLRL